jgi:hypothetical protein
MLVLDIDASSSAGALTFNKRPASERNSGRTPVFRRNRLARAVAGSWQSNSIVP